MTDIVFAIAEGCASVVLGAWIGTKLRKREADSTPAAPPEPTCTGYRAFEMKNGRKTKTYATFTDCRGLRSPVCLDGRCSLHCREMCRCDKT